MSTDKTRNEADRGLQQKGSRDPATGRPRGDQDVQAPADEAAGGSDSSPWETVPSDERPDPTRAPRSAAGEDRP